MGALTRGASAAQRHWPWGERGCYCIAGCRPPTGTPRAVTENAKTLGFKNADWECRRDELLRVEDRSP